MATMKQIFAMALPTDAEFDAILHGESTTSKPHRWPNVTVQAKANGWLIHGTVFGDEIYADSELSMRIRNLAHYQGRIIAIGSPSDPAGPFLSIFKDGAS